MPRAVFYVFFITFMAFMTFSSLELAFYPTIGSPIHRLTDTIRFITIFYQKLTVIIIIIRSVFRENTVKLFRKML
jgi:hypothetical protein